MSFLLMGFVFWGFTRADAHEGEEHEPEAGGAVTAIADAAPSDLPLLTVEELSQFNGQDGQPAYVAVDGLIYDLTPSPSWEDGEHYGYQAGQDLTQALAAAPHGAKVFAGFPVVGQLVGTEVATSSPRTPITIFGLTLSRLSAYLALIFFILNFATCFAMPWSKFLLPWKGKWPGKDKFDEKGYLHLLNIHKPFAWGLLVFAGIHAVLAILQYVFGVII